MSVSLFCTGVELLLRRTGDKGDKDKDKVNVVGRQVHEWLFESLVLFVTKNNCVR
jgi:hypothetical protein